MGLWIKNADGTIERAAGGGGGTFDGDHVLTGDPLDPPADLAAGQLLWDGVEGGSGGGGAAGPHEHDYLPLSGGTLNSGAQIKARGTNSTAPAYSFAANPGCGMYLANGTGAGIIGLSGELWVSDRLRAPSLLVDGNITAAGGTLSDQLTITRYHEALRLKAPVTAGFGSYVAIYHGDTRAGYFGYPSAASGGETILHGDNNTLVLGSAVKVHVTTGLQVDGHIQGVLAWGTSTAGDFFVGNVLCLPALLSDTGVTGLAPNLAMDHGGYVRRTNWQGLPLSGGTVTGNLQVNGKVTGLGAADFQINQGVLTKTWADTALRLQSIDGSSDSNWNSIVGMSFHNKRQQLAMIWRQYERDGEQLGIGNGSGTEYKPIRVQTCYMDSGEAAPRSAWVDDDVALDAAKTFLLTRHAPDPTVMDVVQLDDDDDGNPVYGSAPHDCATGNCVGTADHPCVRVRQQSQERYSTHAGWSHAVTPEVIGTQDADGSAENPAPNGVDIGQMAALSLGASGSLARALEAVCWKFGTDLDEVLAEHRAHKLATVDVDSLGVVVSALGVFEELEGA